LQKGSAEKDWDPHETNGRQINLIMRRTIEDQGAEDFDDWQCLRRLFGKNSLAGGTRENNNGIYGHYKRQASEFITL